MACLTHNLSVGRGMAAQGVILHVGSHKGTGFEEALERVCEGLLRALDEADSAPQGVADCPILIENAAGAGGTVGRSLEEIEAIIEACGGDERLGLCISDSKRIDLFLRYSLFESPRSLECLSQGFEEQV